MGKMLSLAADSHDARHADVRATAGKLTAQMDEGLDVREVVVIYTTGDGLMHYHAAGANHFRLLYIVQRLVQKWLAD